MVWKFLANLKETTPHGSKSYAEWWQDEDGSEKVVHIGDERPNGKGKATGKGKAR